MIAIPAIDLKQGACVQLVGGEWDEERVRHDDPLQVARLWQSHGFRELHVVDLDAALGRGSNSGRVRELLGVRGLTVQAGGGVRDAAAVATLLDAGAARVVVGTRALEDEEWIREMAQAYPQRLIVAADVRGRSVVTRGWRRTTDRDLFDVIDDLNHLPLAGILVTAVHLEGRMRGPDVPLLTQAAWRSRLPIHASGGISTLDHLRTLAARGVAAAVLGMALYTGVLDPVAVAKEFGT